MHSYQRSKYLSGEKVEHLKNILNASNIITYDVLNNSHNVRP